ncbi:MAG: GAF domain-containing sensor histidine kinase [Thermostichales cyanobacterium SZTDM-1c_bins_54]
MPLDSDHLPAGSLLWQLHQANEIVVDLVNCSLCLGQDWQRYLGRAVVDTMVSRLGLASAQVWFYDSQEQCYRSVALAGLVSPAQPRIERLVADDTPIGQMVKQGQPELSNSPAQEPWILSPDWVIAQGLQAFAAYPINLGSEPIGALAIFSYQPLEREFLQVLKLIASFIAMTVANTRQTQQLRQQMQREHWLQEIRTLLYRSMSLYQARLYQQTHTLAQRERLLRQIAQQLTSTHDLQTIRQVALSGIQRAFPGADCAWQTYPPDPQAGAIWASVGQAGILTAVHPHRAFSESDQEWMAALAQMVALSWQRADYLDQLRQQEAQAAIARGLSEGREAESRRLAADLHDQTLADLGSLSRALDRLAHAPRVDPQALLPLHQQLLETIAELRDIVEDLQPTAMRAFTLGAALRSLLERAAQRSPHPLVTRFEDHSGSALETLDQLSRTNLFRMVQEALNNVVKHARAQRVDITITPYPGGIEIKISDDGIGLTPTPHPQPGSHGLANMRYRATLIGATVEWRARRTGTGTVVLIRLPQP